MLSFPQKQTSKAQRQHSAKLKMDELRVVLLGKQGAGKSASGNTLLHQNTFHTGASSERVTEACSMSLSTVDQQTIKVIDTPGWCDFSQSETNIKHEILKCINISSLGPHVFLLVLPIARFTYEERNTIMNILKEFGDEVTKYMIVLFTKGDDLEDSPIEDYLKEVHSDLKKIIQICGNRYHVFNNRDKNNQHQVPALLKKINNMVEKNEKICYTKIMYQKVKDQLDDNTSQRGREADNPDQDKSKGPAETENRSIKNKCDGEKDQQVRESKSNDKREQGHRTMAEQQSKTRTREQEGLNERLREERKRDFSDENEDRCYRKFPEKIRDSWDFDRLKRNLEDSGEISRDKIDLIMETVNESVQKSKDEWLSERDNLMGEINYLQRKVLRKKEKLTQVET